jgi:hypothetical protein
MKGHRQGSAPVVRRWTVVGVFDDHHLAGQAVSELCRAGFGKDQIDVAVPRYGGCSGNSVGEADAERSIGTSSDARLGELVGGDCLDAVIPGVDPADAAEWGKVASWVQPAGQEVAGFVGNLLGADIPEPEARYYRGEWEAGRTVITVASGRRSREAITILRRHGSYDMLSGIVSRPVF